MDELKCAKMCKERISGVVEGEVYGTLLCVSPAG